MRSIFLVSIIFILALSACQEEQAGEKTSLIASGQMPNVTIDHSGNIQLVYGSGDSIVTCFSSDQGKTFSSPALVAVVPELAASHMRGPQIAVTSNAIIITACNNAGDIFSFSKNSADKWIRTARVNDVDTTAKENLIALAADGENAFAVWLDLRNGHNQVFGAKTTDGGKTWSKNILVYASPDTTVCECCKPSVAIKGDRVYVMFRNWLGGNRDLYLVQSSNGGMSFGEAQKLGAGSWALKGCPMDGGGLAIAENGTPATVWNRKGEIYSCEPGQPEKLLGYGKSCTIGSVKGKNIYGWVEAGNVTVLKPGGEKIILGKGQLPIVKAIDKDRAICVWENDKHIYSTIVAL